MLRKLPIIAVFGRGAAISIDRAALAGAAGALVARLGAHLLTGGGYGVMEAAARGFTAVEDRAGLSIGIVPRAAKEPFDQPTRDPEGRSYPNPYVEIAVMTAQPPRERDWRNTPARNHINVLTAHAIVALPGATGTRNELDMAIAYRGEQSRPRARRRTVLLGPADEFTPEHRSLFLHAATTGEVERHLRRILSAQGFAALAEDHGPAS